MSERPRNTSCQDIALGDSEGHQANFEWRRALLTYLDDVAAYLRQSHIVTDPLTPRHPVRTKGLEETKSLVENTLSHLKQDETLAKKNIELVTEVLRTFIIIITSPPPPGSELFHGQLVINSMTSVLKFSYLSGEVLVPAFNALILGYLRRFEQEKSVDDLHQAIGHYAQAMSFISEEIVELPTRLRILGDVHSKQYLNAGGVTNLDLAIECYTNFMDIAQPNDINKRHWLNNLAVCHTLRFKALNQLTDLNSGIDYYSQAHSLTPKGDPGLRSLLSNCSTLREIRYDRLGRTDDLDGAIEFLTSLISFMPNKGSIDLASRMKKLGELHRIRYDRLGNLSDVNLAIEYLRHVLSQEIDYPMIVAACANNLGLAYHARFRYSAVIKDIEESIQYLMQAIKISPPDNPDLTGFLSNLGNAHQWRFQHLFDPADIEKAIEYQAVAVSSTDKGNMSLPGNLNNLGLSYKLRFDYRGDLSNIDTAIEYQTQALELTPNHHPNIAIHFSNLASSYDARFERLHDVNDVDAAIRLHSQALDFTPDGHIALPGRLSNLAGSYKLRFDHLADTSDIDTSITHRTRAVSLTPPEHAEFHQLLSLLGMLHMTRFQRFGDQENLKHGIKYLDQAVSLAPESHPRLPIYLGNLAATYGLRAHRPELGESEDGRRAINLYHRAVRMVSHGTLLRSELLKHLGLAYFDQWERGQDAASLDGAIQAFREVAECEVAYHALDLTPRIVWLGTTVSQRYEDIRYIGSLAEQAAAAAISHCDYELAIEWLEQGRSIVWNQTLQLRTPVEDLHAQNPELANRLQELSIELHRLGSEGFGAFSQASRNLSQEQVAQRHRRLAQEYETILAEIRKMPAFNNFLRPRRFEELWNATRVGPIIIVNAHDSACDALILRKEAVGAHHIPLPNLSVSNITNAHKHMNQYLHRLHLRETSRVKFKQIGSKSSEGHIQSILAGLWDDLAKPVLDALEYSVSRAFYYVHAAGIYAHPHFRIFDYAITSYTPTLSSLLHSDPFVTRRQLSLVAVGQEATPGQTPLPGTKEELASIEKHVEDPIYLSRLEGQDATIEAVLQAMERNDWVHLACHAHQDVRAPTESGFFLHDGTLSLKAISNRAFKGKGLAFLSACQTAQGDEILPDESVHLASGLLTAGYPSVIATMWSVVDVDAPVIADGVYEYLLRDGRMNSEDAAKALHIAVKRLRDHVGEKEFARWAPYVHIGS